jgi:hypothetical protein
VSNTEKLIRDERIWCVLKNKSQTLVVTNSNPASYFIAEVVRPEDANLIAAAPDMYSALENLLPTLTARYGSITEENLLFDVRYALAKARGETK